MKYNRELGKLLMRKYLDTSDLEKKLKHSENVGEFAFKVAQRIKARDPELSLDPEFVGFLGYVHDIGNSVKIEKHEVHTIDILIGSEKIPDEIAKIAMHGQLAEQFGEKEGDYEQYLPIGIEGIILTYADMSVKTGEPIPIRERAKEIIGRVQGCPGMSDFSKQDIIDNMHKALPRFERYERIILALAGADSEKDF